MSDENKKKMLLEASLLANKIKSNEEEIDSSKETIINLIKKYKHNLVDIVIVFVPTIGREIDVFWIDITNEELPKKLEKAAKKIRKIQSNN